MLAEQSVFYPNGSGALSLASKRRSLPRAFLSKNFFVAGIKVQFQLTKMPSL